MTWTEATESAFVDLKLALQTTSILGHPQLLLYANVKYTHITETTGNERTDAAAKKASEEQSLSTTEERSTWPHAGAVLTHRLDQVSKGGTDKKLVYKRIFCICSRILPSLFNMCHTQASRPVQVQQAAHPKPEHVMIDFIELTPSEGKGNSVL